MHTRLFDVNFNDLADITMPYRCNGYFMPGTTLSEKLMDFMQIPEEDRGDHPHWEFPINRWLARNTQLNKKIVGLQLKGVQGYLVISSYTDGDEPQPDETERDRVVRCWLTEWAQVPEDGLMWTSYVDWNGKLTDQGFVPRDLGIRYGKVLPPVTFQQAAEEMEEKFK
ncbi:hypothetical protein FISHEDRAFT_59878 [Fistulina hepatica ATCC 64428]|uniref:Uncharacterized protein n=1 Tax=Fistulina hepatica ATCC 64428 TaxID=1128425 RepID=A0A0D7A7T8_9AGAR|nr:hypothetical protein FISHEDRAFT_59878 [Fistulina hepatica ATCC 64428]